MLARYRLPRRGRPAGSGQAAALTAGFQRGLVLAAILATANLGLALLSRHLVPDAEQVAERAVVG